VNTLQLSGKEPPSALISCRALVSLDIGWFGYSGARCKVRLYLPEKVGTSETSRLLEEASQETLQTPALF
jgi:hypothetical protein